MTELKPCPFCGSQEIQIFDNGKTTKCRCYICFGAGTDYDNKYTSYGKSAADRAIEAWNARTSDNCIQTSDMP